MAVNRYFHICNYSVYRKLFTKRNVVLMCLSFWCIGLVLVLFNLAGIGDHSFDRKSLECIWDRMASRSFTVVFSVVMVWIPLCSISFSYIKIYQHVMKSKKRVHVATVHSMALPNTLGNPKIYPKSMRERDNERGLRLAKTLFVIYAVFTVCWLPYALLIVVDWRDEFAHELHLLITMTAHLHPSLNFIVYYVTHQKFRRAFTEVLKRCAQIRHRRTQAMATTRSFTSNGKSDQ